MQNPPIQPSARTNRSFSVELNSKNQIKNISIAQEAQKEDVLIEGDIGSLVQAHFTEGIMLEVIGEKGVLRLDLREKDITKPKTQGNDCHP